MHANHLLSCSAVPLLLVLFPQAVTNPTNTVYATKRLIGRGFKDEQTQKEMKVRGVSSSKYDASVIEMQQRLICSSWRRFDFSAAAGLSRRRRRWEVARHAVECGWEAPAAIDAAEAGWQQGACSAAAGVSRRRRG
jgi:hypothetical protein